MLGQVQQQRNDRGCIPRLSLSPGLGFKQASGTWANNQVIKGGQRQLLNGFLAVHTGFVNPKGCTLRSSPLGCSNDYPNFFLLNAARPIKPAPTSSMVPGSGTGCVVEK